MLEAAWTTETYQEACQDHVAVFGDAERKVIVVADGAGGTGSGGSAAAAIAEATRTAFAATTTAEGWCGLLRQIDFQIGPGESTAVVVDLRADNLCGASVGDSQAWIVNGTEITDLTAHQRRKPLLGSGRADPVGLTHGSLDGLLVVATDGFCNYVDRTEMVRLIPFEDFAVLPKRFVSLVRLRSGALNDDVGIVICRACRPKANRKRVYTLLE